MISFKMFEAFIKDIIWHDKVAELLGSEWDNGGSYLTEVMWAECDIIWNEAGTDLISEYVMWVTYGKRGNAPHITTPKGEVYAASIKILWEILNEYCCIDEDEF